MAKVAAYVLGASGMAKRLVPLMAQGSTVLGDSVTTYADTHYKPEHAKEYDTVIFWGYVETCQAIMKGFIAEGKAAVYLDLAYWERGTHYKVSVNDRHPTAYFQDVKHDSVRREMFKVFPKPYQKNERGHILIAGMSKKAAWAEGREPVESWELAAIAELKKHTDREIIYRPKPSFAGAKPLEGSKFSDPKTSSLDSLLKGCYAVVAYHSNVATDGLVEGVPAFVCKGVAKPMALSDLSQIDTPLYPDDREQWANNIAYCQWSEVEMKTGVCWAHLKQEGLIA